MPRNPYEPPREEATPPTKPRKPISEMRFAVLVIIAVLVAMVILQLWVESR